EWRAKLALTDDREDEFALWYLSLTEWRAGNYELAARYARESLAVREQFGIEGSQPVAELPAAMADAYRGEIEAARQRSVRALARAEADGIRIAQSGHRAVLGFIALSEGDPQRALEYLRPGWAIRDRAVLMEPGHRFELADALEAMIAVGALDEAESRLAVWEERSRRLDRAWALAITARCRALLHAARGDAAAAQVGFAEALAQHARSDDPFQLARTLLAQGVTQRRALQRSAARATLARAVEVFERIGSPLWAERARAEVKRIGGRAPGRDQLTESERRVAALVVQGKTNHEVAAALFLGERTVASHLTHIYAKLGVRSRTQLARRLE
ncbi:MAG TPA: LuxR C-terminal-related transcriptional regulator, partial [Gemmatimonadaceae bacterium]|nr:LuxR C-terminal-related transcriptional regulator [Gemmatimonadaceae bacterium]